MSSTQYEYDFEYDTGRAIPRDSAGWQDFHDARKNNIKKWVENALLESNDSAFFNIPYAKQKQLQQQHPSLEEAWKTYLTLLQVTNE